MISSLHTSAPSRYFTRKARHVQSQSNRCVYTVKYTTLLRRKWTNSELKHSKKIIRNSPDAPAAVIDEVVAVAAAAVAEASAMSVAERFGPATREAKLADSPTPVTASSVLGQREVVEAVEEEFEAAVAVADDRRAVAGSCSCHKVPAEKPVDVMYACYEYF